MKAQGLLESFLFLIKNIKLCHPERSRRAIKQ